VAPARRALRAAGDRAFALNAFAAAARFYSNAAELCRAADDDRPEILFRLAHALYQAADESRERALDQARDALLAVGNHERAAEVSALTSGLWWHRGDRDRSREHLDRALQLVADLPASPGKARVLSLAGGYHSIAEENEAAIRFSAEALAIADALGLDELRARALNNIGCTKANVGDLAGFADLEQSVEIALAANSLEAVRAYTNLAAITWEFGDARRAAPLFDEAVRLGEQLGSPPFVDFSRAARIESVLFPSGQWNEGFRRADELIAACEAGERSYGEIYVRRVRAKARLARDDVDGAIDDIGKTIEQARKAKDPRPVLQTLACAARIYAELGQIENARPLAVEFLTHYPGMTDWTLADLGWVADAVGCAGMLRELLERVRTPTKWGGATRAVLDVHFETAAELFYEIGMLDDEAHARLRAAEHLVKKGRFHEADDQLQRALAFFRSVGATRYIREAEVLLTATA
jgi:tetratricopeptide (TPR) repeat protein